MSMRIEINIDPSQGDASEQLRAHLAALGYVRESATPARTSRLRLYGETDAQAPARHDSAFTTMTETPAVAEPARHADGLTTLTDAPLIPEVTAPEPDVEPTAAPVIEAATETPPAIAAKPGARVPGQPAPGRLRRTKAEMAEDAALEAAGQARHKTLASSLALISTGEERIDPAVDAQDRADEEAEAAAVKKTGLSMEDLREAVARFVRKVGIPRAQKEVPAILGCPMIAVPETDEALSAAIAKIEAVIKTGDVAPLVEKPASVAALIAAVDEPHATLSDVVEAFRAYARKYDGHDDFGRAAIVREDGPRLLEQTLGVRDVNQIEKDPAAYGEALTAINEAVLSNPFKREVRG